MSRPPLEHLDSVLDDLLATATDGAQPLGDDDVVTAGSRLTAADAREVFAAMVTSRALDLAARTLRARGQGFYTIGSAGHEHNALVGALTRPTDPAFLHYRSGALYVARAQQVPGSDAVGETIASMAASRDDPIAEGRHKVWGSDDRWIPPQTSTIASQLPKAVGTAFALGRRRRLGAPRSTRPGDVAPAAGSRSEPPDDAIVVASFGDASANHATALSAINAARWSHRHGSPVPIVLVCEDNGLGISVQTPPGWIRSTFGSLPHLRYVHAAGHLDEVHAAVADAVETCRARRAPVFLHLPTVRLGGHAGSDVETGYRGADEIAADQEHDPVLLAAQRLLQLGAATTGDLQRIVAGVRDRVADAVQNAASLPRLATREEIMAPLAPYDDATVRTEAAARVVDPERRAQVLGSLPEDATTDVRRTMGAQLNAALHDELLRRPEMVVFGQDVARKGGVYHVTAGLQDRFGQERVFDTLLDETTILGVAQGMGMLGALPVPEIQYLAYVHNALDQIRGEAATTQFFSAGRYRAPMVVRIASFAYQKGFGGHFHNDNAIGALRDIPGVLLATPSRGDDAARMLRGCLAVAQAHGRVVCFLEPIALYHERDLYEAGDGAWLFDHPAPPAFLLPGEVGTYGPDAADVCILTYANGVRMSLRAARRLEQEDGIRARVVDLRWLTPLPWPAIEAAARSAPAVLVVDEARATGGGVADAVVAGLAERGASARLASVRAADSFVPLGPLADLVLVQEAEVVEAAREVATSTPRERTGTRRRWLRPGGVTRSRRARPG